MKRLISTITLIATLGFVLPTSVEAAKPERKHKKSQSHNSPHPKRAKQTVHAGPIPGRAPGTTYYSNRMGPVTVYPAPRRPQIGPRRTLFSFFFRL